MIVSTLLALAIGQSSLFRDVVTQPTGRNGYEEYVRAAELVKKPELSALITWNPQIQEQRRSQLADLRKMLAEASDPLAKRELQEDIERVERQIQQGKSMEGKSKLEIANLLEQSFQPVLRLVEAGNRKQVLDPRVKPDMETLFPEFSYFRQIIRGGVQVAFSQAASGRNLAAGETVGHLFRFNDRFGRFLLIGCLVSRANQSIITSSVEPWLDRFSKPALRSVLVAVEESLQAPPALSQALESETAFSVEIEKLLAEGDGWEALVGRDDEEVSGDARERELAARFGKLSPAGRRQVGQRYAQMAREHIARVRAVMENPESAWIDEVDPPKSGDDLVDFLYESITISYDQILRTEAIHRTKTRLLRAKLLYLLYAWEHGNPPTSIDQFMTAKEEADPLSGGQIQMTIREGKVVLYSKGVPKTGEITLTSPVRASSGTSIEPPPQD